MKTITKIILVSFFVSVTFLKFSFKSAIYAHHVTKNNKVLVERIRDGKLLMLPLYVVTRFPRLYRIPATPSATPSPVPDRWVKVTSPNGGETVQAGQTHRITWDSSSNIDMVSIGYSFGPGSLNWIAYNIQNTGFFDWTVNVGNTVSTNVKIEVIGYQTGVGSIFDQSDDYFTVLQPSSPSPSSFPVPTPTATPTPQGGSITITISGNGDGTSSLSSPSPSPSPQVGGETTISTGNVGNTVGVNIIPVNGATSDNSVSFISP